MKSDARLFRKPSLLVLISGCVLLPIAVFALLNWGRINSAYDHRSLDVLRTPAIYIEHIGDEDKPVYPLVIATEAPKDAELCAAFVEPSSRHSAKVYPVSESELAQSLKLMAAIPPGTAPSEFRYVVVEHGRPSRSGSLDLEQSRTFVNNLAAYFADRRPDLSQRLNELRRALGET